MIKNKGSIYNKRNGWRKRTTGRTANGRTAPRTLITATQHTGTGLVLARLFLFPRFRTLCVCERERPVHTHVVPPREDNETGRPPASAQRQAAGSHDHDMWQLASRGGAAGVSFVAGREGTNDTCCLWCNGTARHGTARHRPVRTYVVVHNFSTCVRR